MCRYLCGMRWEVDFWVGLHNYVTSPDKGQGSDQQKQQQHRRRRHRIGGIIGAEWVGEERRELTTANCFFPWRKSNIKVSHNPQAAAGEEGISEVDDGETSGSFSHHPLPPFRSSRQRGTGAGMECTAWCSDGCCVQQLGLGSVVYTALFRRLRCCL